MPVTQNQKPALYWMDKAYTPGCIFKHMIAMAYETVVTLDIGHGECVAYQYLINHSGKWDTYRLKLNNGGDFAIPSYITYLPAATDTDTEVPCIGHPASGYDSKLIAYFKRDPSQWNDIHENDTHTTGQIMTDFIRQLWKDILKNNPTVSNVDKDKVLIAIGCPASPDWTGEEAAEAYCALVKKATGYDHVTVLPESNAAIMAAIYSKKLGNQVDLSQGIAMYDFGSSTIDFTFILIGKAIVTRSITLGGSNIDRALLEIIARKSLGEAPAGKEHTLYKTKNIPPQEREKACAIVRGDKEQFFNGGQLAMAQKPLTLKRLIHIPITPEWLNSKGIPDADYLAYTLWKDLSSGELKDLALTRVEEAKYIDRIREGIAQVQKTGEAVELPINTSTVLKYSMDKKLMDSALKDIHWKNIKGYSYRSWYDIVTDFFSDTRSLIQDYGCGAVILTGGTSKVACIREIAEKCYGKDRILCEDNTSDSVAIGLCHATGKEVDAAKRLPDLRRILKEDQQKQFESFCDSLANDCLFDLFWNAFADAASALAKDGQPHITADLTDALEAATVKSSQFIQTLQEAVKDHVLTFWPRCIQYSSCPHKEPGKKQQCSSCTVSKSCAETVRRAVNSLSKQVYQGQITALPALPNDLTQTMACALDGRTISAVIMKAKPTKLIINAAVNMDMATLPQKENKKSSIFKKIENMIDDAMERIANEILKPFFKHILRQPNSTLSEYYCEAIAKALSDPKIKEAQRFSFVWDLKTTLKQSEDFRSAFRQLQENQLEIALGIVLFQIFENANIQ